MTLIESLEESQRDGFLAGIKVAFGMSEEELNSCHHRMTMHIGVPEDKIDKEMASEVGLRSGRSRVDFLKGAAAGMMLVHGIGMLKAIRERNGAELSSFSDAGSDWLTEFHKLEVRNEQAAKDVVRAALVGIWKLSMASDMLDGLG